MQANSLNDTEREVASGVRLVPLRVIVRAFLASIDRGQDPWEITLPFSTILRMFNTPAIYQDPIPSSASLLDVIDGSIGQPVIPGTNLGYFKRNFHILEQTGLLRRTSDKNAFQLQLGDNAHSAEQSLRLCRAIAESGTFYDGFEKCANSDDLRQSVQDTITSLQWCVYFDGGKLPANLLKDLTVIPTPVDDIPASLLESTHSLQLPDFPALATYNPTSENPRPATLIGQGTPANPEQTRVLREKANRSHARIVQLLSSTAKAAGHEPTDNLYIDLCLNAVPLIIEVKSCNDENMLSQIRRGLANYMNIALGLGLRMRCFAWHLNKNRPVRKVG